MFIQLMDSVSMVPIKRTIFFSTEKYDTFNRNHRVSIKPCPSMCLKAFWTVQIILVEYLPIIFNNPICFNQVQIKKKMSRKV